MRVQREIFGRISLLRRKILFSPFAFSKNAERARGPVSYPSFSPRHRDGRTGRSYNGEGGEGEREFELAGRIEGEGGIILGHLCFRSRPAWRRTPGSERASKWPDSSLSNTRSGVVSSYFFGKLGKISSSCVGLAPFSWYRTSEDAPLSMFASRIRRCLPSSELNTNDRIRHRRGVIEATRPRLCREDALPFDFPHLMFWTGGRWPASATVYDA